MHTYVDKHADGRGERVKRSSQFGTLTSDEMQLRCQSELIRDIRKVSDTYFNETLQQGLKFFIAVL